MVGSGVDGLSVTVGSALDQDLLEGLGRRARAVGGELFEEEGNPQPGFGASWRVTLATPAAEFTYWRRVKPRVPSKRYGDSYASWEAMGQPAELLAEVLADDERDGDRGRASRLDVAFDFDCAPDELPKHWREELRDGVGFVGEEDAFSLQGGEDTGTWYRGAPTSERRVRCYRWDLAHGGSVPRMRVEAQLRKQRAQQAWVARCESRERVLSVGAECIRDLCGMEFPEVERSELPAIEVRARSKLVATATALLVQHGGTLRLLRDLGIDLAELESLVQRSKMSESRIRRLKASAAGKSAAEIRSEIVGSLRRPARRAGRRG